RGERLVVDGAAGGSGADMPGVAERALQRIVRARAVEDRAQADRRRDRGNARARLAAGDGHVADATVDGSAGKLTAAHATDGEEQQVDAHGLVVIISSAAVGRA